MKYDDASWHYGGKFPKDLPIEAGATHTGMFLAWAFLLDLAGEIHIEDFPDDIPKLKSRSVTPGAFFLASCDGKFTDEDLNDEGNAFAQAYFDFKTGKYLADYETTLGSGLPDMYYVKDSWESFDRLKPVLDQRLNEYKATQGIYPELKADLQRLAEVLFEFSGKLLKKRGAFLPHGAALSVNNEVRMVAAAPEDFEQRLVSTTEVLPLLHDALRQVAATEDVKAIAVAEDVRITLEGESETKAMKVLVEHKRGLCVAYYVPYSKSFFGGCKFGEMIGREAKSEVLKPSV